MVDRKSTIPEISVSPLRQAVGRGMTTRAGILALAAASSALCCAMPAFAATQNASVNANVVKPLTLTSLQNLDLGTITLKPGTWSSANVGISRTGVFSCNTANLVCTGLTQVARYKVTGTNKQNVSITAPSVTLVNQGDPTKNLTLVVDSPAQLQLTSSGEPGSNFDIGGSITLSPTTAAGTYQGTFNVTVDYQ
jgi:hypothetical protein